MDKELKDSALKTGTTLVGIVCKDGIVMGTERQTTLGQSVVADKRSEKIKQINDYLVISGSGVVSDIQRTQKVLPAELRLKELKSKSRPSIQQAASLLSNMTYSNIRQPSMIPAQVGFLVAGYNEDGTTELYSIIPDGAVKKVEDYDGNVSSGMPYVLGFLERQYRKNITVKEGVKLAQEALKSSTQRDVGSGYGVDIFSITKEGIKKEVEQKIVSDYQNE